MAFRVYTLRQRPELRRHFDRLHGKGWPSFLVDDAANALWPQLYALFPDFQLGLRDEAGRVAAIGNSIPFLWDGTPQGLPDQVVDILANGIETRKRNRAPTALSALAAIVDDRYRGRDLSRRLIAAMADVAARHGLDALVAPVRPSLKGRYPLTRMERYAQWTRGGDGAPFDPWLRVHWRLGARVLGITPRGNTVKATVTQWEERTGMRFPESGRYIVPGAFQPIRVDRERNRVYYEEASVWMVHPRGAANHRARRRVMSRR